MKKLLLKIKYVWRPLTIAWIIDNLFLSWFAPIGRKADEYLKNREQAEKGPLTPKLLETLEYVQRFIHHMG